MDKANKQKVEPLIFDTYLAVIKNSVGTKFFRNFYAKVNGKRTDVMKNGELSCAFFVSTILAFFKLIKEVHTTVDSTIKDLKISGWKITKRPKIGSIIIWEKQDFGNVDFHRHIGFYIGDNKAISNSSKFGYSAKHHWTFKNKRKIEMIFWNKKLN